MLIFEQIFLNQLRNYNNIKIELYEQMLIIINLYI